MDSTAKAILGSLSLGLLVGTSRKGVGIGSTNNFNPYSFDSTFIDDIIRSKNLNRDFMLVVSECDGKDAVFILIDNGAKQVALSPENTCWYWNRPNRDKHRYKVNTKSSYRLLETAKQLFSGIESNLLREV